jgi:hypothetical protein
MLGSLYGVPGFGLRGEEFANPLNLIRVMPAEGEEPRHRRLPLIRQPQMEGPIACAG